MSISTMSALYFPNCVQVSSKPGLSSDISQSKSKLGAEAEKTTVKKKKKDDEAERAMDDVQPLNSISNVSPS